MPAPTKRQREVLEIITRYFESNGYRPSYQQIAKHLGLRSRAGIARIVQDLESKGLLERRRENGHFTIDVKEGGSGVTIGWLEPEEMKNGPLRLPGFMVGSYDTSELCAFRVTDAAMEPEIEQGDIALIEIRDFCRDRTTIVASLPDGRNVLRKYFRVNSEIELRSANEETETITVAANRVKIIGVYRGLIRPAV